MASTVIADALIEAYKKRKAEYESFGKFNHPEYKKICEQLKKWEGK